MTCKQKSCARPRRYVMVIEKPKTDQAVDGHVDLTNDDNWEFANRRRVSFKTRGGSEGRVFDQTLAETDYLLDFQSDSFTRSILPSWRGRIGSRVFQFLSVLDVDEERHTVLVEAAEAK